MHFPCHWRAGTCKEPPLTQLQHHTAAAPAAGGAANSLATQKQKSASWPPAAGPYNAAAASKAAVIVARAHIEVAGRKGAMQAPGHWVTHGSAPPPPAAQMGSQPAPPQTQLAGQASAGPAAGQGPPLEGRIAVAVRKPGRLTRAWIAFKQAATCSDIRTLGEPR